MQEICMQAHAQFFMVSNEGATQSLHCRGVSAMENLVLANGTETTIDITDRVTFNCSFESAASNSVR